MTDQERLCAVKGCLQEGVYHLQAMGFEHHHLLKRFRLCERHWADLCARLKEPWGVREEAA
jgi:hypothetical protein